ncbi:MAG: PilZ domain-containing protein [Gammaproteobacteria bacterium]|nr:PilZ domain-containing protein [Gammaproteobacteria bacterium]
MQDNTTIRKYIRHPSDVPIQVVLDRVDDSDDGDETLTNISLGGLSFVSPEALDVLQKVRVCIPLIKQNNFLEGRVVWCEKAKNGYEIGLEFDRSEEVFRLRMIEQICHIEHYRREVEQQQGRTLSIEEAAKEWISEYAGDFPAL